MSSLKVNQIRTKLRGMFESHLDLKDVPPKDLERENKILSRCLAALAIYMQTGCTEKQAAESVWDGGDDNGIDAAYFDPVESTVLFVQSKWINKGSGEPEAKEIAVFATGVKDAIEQEATRFSSRLQGRFSDISQRIVTPGTFIRVVLISTGSSQLAAPGAAHIERLLNEMNGSDPDPIMSAQVFGLNEVYSALSKDPLHGNLTLGATLTEWSSVATPYPAYFGLIDGHQLKEWWTTHGRSLVSGNIRHSLGATDVNSEIMQTATKTPEKFWYFNNGITLVADEAIKAPVAAASRSAGVFSFKGASIVNGAQTVSSLGKVENNDSLGLVRVPIRVILLKTAPSNFGSEVTRTNNLQNRIEPRDFVAQDEEQARLRQEMAMEEIDYQFVRSEEVSTTPKSCDLIEATTALACASGDPALAVQVKAGIGKFFVDLSKPPYKAIFNSSTSGAKTFNAISVQRQIDLWIDKRKRLLLKKSGPSWGVLVHGNRILSAAVFHKFEGSKLSQPITSFSKSFDPSSVEKLCDTVYGRMVFGIQHNYESKILAVLFKNQALSKEVFDLAVA
jgi:hypothetical protein